MSAKEAKSVASKKAKSETKSEVKSPLSRLGLDTPASLALHLPIRYEDETELLPIREALVRGQFASVQTQGRVTRCDVMFRPRRQLIVAIEDDEEELLLRFLNFYPSQQKQMAVGTHLRVRGDIRSGYQGPEMVHPQVKALPPDAPLPLTLTPVYSTTAGLGQHTLRKAVDKALKEPSIQAFLSEIFPSDWWHSQQHAQAFKSLPSLERAIRTLHHPSPDVDKESLLDRTHPAWRRVQFEELLAQQISLQQAHSERRKRLAPMMGLGSGKLVEALLSLLPFELTHAQKRCWMEVAEDLSKPYPMNRLLQGDVGSGKTAVSALAAAHAIDHGYQVALMAPTEILAEQHFRKFVPWFQKLGVEIVWLSGSLKAKEKRAAQAAISSGQARLAIGTHALIQEDVVFENLGLAMIDEQHRFGVRQRLQLHSKNGQEELFAHQIMMSATPIPRTLAMTYYADLDVSVIDELPPGRKPVSTKLIKENRREEVIEGVRKELSKGRQAYWVCPLIEESEALQLKTAVETWELLTQQLPDFKIGMVHGRMSTEEKSAVMEAFYQGQIHLLVATTVIEVGVDVPNASLMIIEHAERFGYAQLHQLRGRVGRGANESVCLLMYSEPLSLAAKERLQTLREVHDGFVIAERDLALRGPGELLGARQSGDAMLRFVDLQRDAWLVELGKDVAHDLLETYPEIAMKHLQRWLGARADYLKA
jgi:ATP-dependent DNA helicase RecG